MAHIENKVKCLGRIVLTGLILLGSGAALPLAAQTPAACRGLTLDHAVKDSLKFDDNKGPPDSIPDAKKAGSLTGVEVLDCDQDYYYVRYQKRTRAIRRLNVVAGKPLSIPICAKDQQKLAGNGAVDGQVCKPG